MKPGRKKLSSNAIKCMAWKAARQLDIEKLGSIIEDVGRRDVCTALVHNHSIVQALFAAFYVRHNYCSSKDLEDVTFGDVHRNPVMRMPEGVADVAPLLFDCGADIMEYLKSKTGSFKEAGAKLIMRMIPLRDDAQANPDTAWLRDGTVLMTVAEAKRRFGECLRIVIEICGGADSPYFKTALDCCHQSTRLGERGCSLPQHPITLAIGRNLPGVGNMIRAAAADTESVWRTSKRGASRLKRRQVCHPSGFGLQFLREAKLYGTNYGLPILAAKTGCVEALQALLDAGVEVKRLGWTVMHEACLASQPEMIRFCADVLKIKPGTKVSAAGKNPLAQCLNAPSSSGLELLVSEYGAGNRYDGDDWGELLALGLQGEWQSAICVALMGFEPDMTTLDRTMHTDVWAGQQLLHIAVSHHRGFDEVLDDLLDHEWPKRCIGAYLDGLHSTGLVGVPWLVKGMRNYVSFNGPTVPRPYDRRAERATFALLQRGLIDPSVLAPAVTQYPSRRVLVGAIHHGYVPGLRDVGAALINLCEGSLCYDSGTAWQMMSRQLCQHRSVSHLLRHGLVRDTRDLSMPPAPLAACIAQVVVGLGNRCNRPIQQLAEWIPFTMSQQLSHPVSKGHLVEMLTRMCFQRVCCPPEPRAYSPLAWSVLFNLRKISTFLVLRGARLCPSHDVFSEEILRTLHGTRYDRHVKQNRVLLNMLIQQDMDGIKTRLLGDRKLPSDVYREMGGNLERQHHLAAWRRTNLVHSVGTQAWTWARRGNMRSLRKSLLLGVEAGALLEKQPMTVASGEAMGGGYRDGRVRSTAGRGAALAATSLSASAASSVASGVRQGTYRSNACTVLMAAAASGCTTAVEVLLALGMDPRETSSDGATAAVWADRAGAEECAAVLRDSEYSYRLHGDVEQEAASRHLEAADEVQRLEAELRRMQEVKAMAAEDRDSAAWAPRRTALVTHGAHAAAALSGRTEGAAMVRLAKREYGSSAMDDDDDEDESERRPKVDSKQMSLLNEVRLPGGAAVCELAGVPSMQASKGAVLKWSKVKLEERQRANERVMDRFRAEQDRRRRMPYLYGRERYLQRPVLVPASAGQAVALPEQERAKPLH